MQNQLFFFLKKNCLGFLTVLDPRQRKTGNFTKTIYMRVSSFRIHISYTTVVFVNFSTFLS